MKDTYLILYFNEEINKSSKFIEDDVIYDYSQVRFFKDLSNSKSTGYASVHRRERHLLSKWYEPLVVGNHYVFRTK